MSYNDYLRTDHWKKTRELKLFLRSKCQVCDSGKSLQIHHKKYRNIKTGESILYKEGVTDLITLCASCHRLMHYHFGIEVQKINKKILRIRRLMELGSDKKMAFYLATQNELFLATRQELVKMQ